MNQVKADIWSIYTAQAERNSQIRDRFGRSTYVLTDHSPNRPWVSRYLHGSGFRPEYPQGKKWALLLSHDIDVLNRLALPFKSLIPAQVKRLVKAQLGSFVDGWKARKNQPVSEFSLDRVRKVHKERGLRTTYFFLALEEGEEDFNYRITDIGGELEEIRAEGNEVALHGGHRAYNSIEEMGKELERLKLLSPDVIGYRNHYLRFDIGQTWKLVEQLGFSYDATFGFAGYPGFRNGMCHPFRPYDTHSEAYIDVLEFPLHVMDVSLFKYLGLAPEAAFEYVKNLALEVEESNGVFSILWHNNYFSGEWGDFYLKVLDYLLQREPFVGTHRELHDWWKEKNYAEEMEVLLERERVGEASS